jgi:hypothetical protein
MHRAKPEASFTAEERYIIYTEFGGIGELTHIFYRLILSGDYTNYSEKVYCYLLSQKYFLIEFLSFHSNYPIRAVRLFKQYFSQFFRLLLLSILGHNMPNLIVRLNLSKEYKNIIGNITSEEFIIFSRRVHESNDYYMMTREYYISYCIDLIIQKYNISLVDPLNKFF